MNNKNTMVINRKLYDISKSTPISEDYKLLYEVQWSLKGLEYWVTGIWPGFYTLEEAKEFVDSKNIRAVKSVVFRVVGIERKELWREDE